MPGPEEDYKNVAHFIAKQKKKINPRYRLAYHIMGEVGWINDPNGLVYDKGIYHVFFQYHPFSPAVGPTCWGHVTSQDGVHWKYCPIALTPVNSYDQDGCFSGSAIVKDKKLHLIYSGHKNTNDGYRECQNIAISKDGIEFEKQMHNPVITSPPPCSTKRFRDPKVWFEDSVWKMVIGSENQYHEGQALIYDSKNLVDWNFNGILAHTGNRNGYMWECPDYFQLEGKHILLISIKSKDENHRENYQTGVLVEQENGFSSSPFQELDIGNDFYAAQTFIDEKGKRVLIAWMGMPDKPPLEQQDGWAGALTLPRELFLNASGKVCMKPAEQLKALRGKGIQSEWQIKPHQIKSLASGKQFELTLSLTSDGDQIQAFDLSILSPMDRIEINYFNAIIQFSQKSNTEAKKVQIDLSKQINLHFYVDVSSIELFIDNGELSFTSRIYSETGYQVYLTSPIETLRGNQTYWKIERGWQ